MDCPTCRHPNPDDASFCGECGATLARERSCGSCGRRNPGQQRFCHGCGAELVDSPSTPEERNPLSYTPKHLAEKILQSKSALEGERKQISVLFADIKGSMDLQEALDPEDWHGIMERFLEILGDGVHRFEGTVNQYTGDGIMALFGAPIAHEDHARRACYAALHLRDEFRSYANELRMSRGLSFSVRMGINSGEVVVGKIGDDLRMDYTAQGHSVGLAARMQQLAEPGNAYLTEHTAELVKGYFQLGDLGQLAIKGVHEKVSVFELEGIGALRTRLDVSRARGFSRFVGRADEMQVLEAALARAEEGNPAVIGIVADAGVGKSRLCFEFLERCRARGLMTYETHGVAHGKSVPLLPILRLFRAFFGITEQDSDSTARERIAGRLLLLDDQFRELLPLMFDFLGVASPEDPAPRVDAETRQRQLFAIVRGVAQARSDRETTVVLVEDLHWFDGGSEAFLGPLLDLPPGARTLFVLNFRPEYSGAMMQRSSYQHVSLQPLGSEAISELLADLLGSHPSLEQLPDLICERTGGNPFFIEEVVLSLAESGVLQGAKAAYQLVRPIGEVGIPQSVHDILAARIDRLDEMDKQVLQSAAVIGKKFPETVLRRIVELADPELVVALRALQNAEFIYEASLYPDTEYAFKHPLTQLVSYETQLRDRRARIHAAVARVVEDLNPDKLDEQSALLAYHWEQAGDPRQASIWNGRAAEWAGRTDPAEALRHWQKSRALLAEIPETPESRGMELQSCRGILPLAWRLKVSADDAAETFERGRELAEKAKDPASLAALHLHYGMYRGFSRTDVPGFAKHAREAVALAERTEDEGLLLAAGSSLSLAFFLEGNLGEAAAVGDRLLRSQPDDLTVGSEHWGFSPFAQLTGLTRAFKGWAGRPEGVLEGLELSLRIARQQGSVELESYIQFWGVIASEFLGRADIALTRGRQSVETAERSGVPVAVVYANFGLGIAHCIAESWADAAHCLERAVQVAREEETAQMEEPAFLARLGEAYAGLGDGTRAKETVEQALLMARERLLPLNEAIALLARVRVLRRIDGKDAREEIEETLSRAATLADRLGYASLVPFLHLERAALCEQTGDRSRRESELRRAHELFERMGATAHLESISRQLS